MWRGHGEIVGFGPEGTGAMRENSAVTLNPSSANPTAAASRLAVGTAQFGFDYGISNAGGQVSLEVAKEVLSVARAAGCDTLDTAIAYGDSEARLGRIGVDGWQIVSKLPAFAPDTADLGAWARAQVQGSLERLQVPRLDTLLLHAPAQLASARGNELFAALARLRDEGLLSRLGVSIYSPNELEALVPRFAIDVVQAPHNVLDGSLDTSGWAERLAQQGIEIHVRSTFLQGLLLMRPDQRPAYFSEWNALWELWEGWLLEHRLSAVQACMRHVMAQGWAGKVVVGVTSPEELKDVIEASRGPLPPLPPLPQELRCRDRRLINPALWKTS